ncbi:Homeodomain-like protein [Aspergillus crustosus]
MAEVRRRWTSPEDALLFELYQIQEKAPTGKCQKINWNEIARHIPGRSNKDCRKRYYNRFTGGLRKGSWTQEEDERLFQLVERYQYRWATIAQKMETRNADQCSKRWHHCLNPELERSPWSDEENELLLSAVGTHGSSWKDIQRCHFPTRSANNIKNQYTILSRRSLNPTHLHPCCSAPMPPTPKSIPSSRRPPSSTPSVASSHATSYDHYSYNSLSSTPQLSAQDYLPSTPDTSGSMNGFDFHTSMPLPLANDPCGYMPQYTSSPFYGHMDSSQFGMVDSVGMQIGYGLDLGHFQDGGVNQGGRYQHFPSGHQAFGI